MGTRLLPEETCENAGTDMIAATGMQVVWLSALLLTGLGVVFAVVLLAASINPVPVNCVAIISLTVCWLKPRFLAISSSSSAR